ASALFSGNLLYGGRALRHRAGRDRVAPVPVLGRQRRSRTRRRARLFDESGMEGYDAGESLAAAPSRAPTLAASPAVLARKPGLAERYAEWCRRISERFAEADLVPDLAEDIGSRRWLRGAGTLLGLSALALAGWPDFAPLEAAPVMQIDDPVRDEFRSQMIMPLALGADSGRRMGATDLVIPLRRAPERPRLDREATLVRGDSFGRMLQRAGLGGPEAEQVVAMVASAVDLAEIAPGTTVDITLGRRPAPGAARPLEALSFRARFDLQLAV